MERYLKLLKRLIKKSSKAKVAVALNISDTRTIDQWIQRQSIPSKYLDKLKEI